ncbi:conserved hypothetical protein [Perkinsus marinus ATCC 50983]|uniref:Uncharacterized protein n=1 Tax=Perkinsus marinus (strain ATCC 50983 / TXsc) TaxID=423536 RepID=C5LW08_PERM5|nr:conserved hypothetical protein [Perkinsus marinus ATCC 50983]EEQ99078.1 conserved hypothetical protein [Perkinsus marinus ATCC 50983]|eukprot:XP_002766361.1 conserved hypothetical protein [Perkinsus marinus ATCC 50983]
MSVILGGKWADLKVENDRLRDGIAAASRRCAELERELAEARSDKSSLSAQVEARTTEVEEKENALHEMSEAHRSITDRLERTTHELHDLKAECQELKSLIMNKDRELGELHEVKSHSDEVAEKLARDLAARDEQVAQLTDSLEAQKFPEAESFERILDIQKTFEKASKDSEILRKLNQQKDVKIATLTKEKSRLIERL